MSPATPDHYRARAEECERLAASATSEETRETMIFLAHRWRTMAAEDEARGKAAVQPPRRMLPPSH